MATLKNDPNAKDTITIGTDVGGGSAAAPAMGGPATPAVPAANKAQTGSGFVNLQNYMSAAKPGQVEAMGARAAQGLGTAIGGVKAGVDQANVEFGKDLETANNNIWAKRDVGQQVTYAGPSNLQNTGGYSNALKAQDAGDAAAKNLGSSSGQGTELAAAYGYNPTTQAGISKLNQSLVNANQGAQQAIKAQTDAWGGLKDYVSGANTAATKQADDVKAQSDARNTASLNLKRQSEAIEAARKDRQDKLDKQAAIVKAQEEARAAAQPKEPAMTQAQSSLGSVYGGNIADVPTDPTELAKLRAALAAGKAPVTKQLSPEEMMKMGGVNLG